MLAPVVAVLMTVVAFSDGTEPQVFNTEPMPPAECARRVAKLTLALAESPAALTPQIPDIADHPVLAWSVTCQMERSDARVKL